MDQLRIGDAERDAGVAALGEHFAQGRLTRQEYDERSEALWSAKTRGDVAPLFADLPTEATRAAASAGVAPQPRRPDWLPPWLSQGLLGPLVAVLVVLTVLTHLPFVLGALLVWFLLGRRHRAARRPWGGQAPRSR